MEEEVILKAMHCCTNIDTGCDVCPFRKNSKACDNLLQNAIDIIEKQQETIETLEQKLLGNNVEVVVYCKDCIYGVIGINNKQYVCIKDNQYRKSDYFCANGKQKGNDTNV